MVIYELDRGQGSTMPGILSPLPFSVLRQGLDKLLGLALNLLCSQVSL